MYSLSQSMKAAFKSDTFGDLLRLKGWGDRDEAVHWPQQPEQFGIDISCKAGMTQREKDNYDFWSKIASEGFKVGAGSFHFPP